MYSTAAPNPTTPAMFGVPASNLYGSELYVVFVEGDRGDHVAAALVRRHAVQQRRLAVEHTRPSRPEHLVAREGIKVGVQLLHIDGHVRRSLGAVDERDRAGRVRLPHDLGNRDNRPERVRHVDHRDDARAIGEEAVELVEPQLPAVVNRHRPERRTRLRAHELPRDDVGVVLHPGDEHLVTRLQERAAPGLRDQVDAVRTPAREDDLAAVCRVDEPLQQHARTFVGSRRPLAEHVRGAVDVRVGRRVVVGRGVDDRLRLLGRVRIVQVHERVPVHLLVQDREIGADAVHVECLRLFRCHTHVGHPSVTESEQAVETPPTYAAPLGMSASNVFSSRSRSGANFTLGHGVAGEAADEERTRVSETEPAGAQVEQHVGIELAHRRPVRALHVVGEDLELRLRVDLRLVVRGAAPCSSAWRRSSAHRAGR